MRSENGKASCTPRRGHHTLCLCRTPWCSRKITKPFHQGRLPDFFNVQAPFNQKGENQRVLVDDILLPIDGSENHLFAWLRDVLLHASSLRRMRSAGRGKHIAHLVEHVKKGAGTKKNATGQNKRKRDKKKRHSGQNQK